MSIRELDAAVIRDKVADMCIKASYTLCPSVKAMIGEYSKTDSGEVQRDIFTMLCRNAEIAEDKRLPLCQDTGMAVLFIDIGQDVHITGSLTDAVNEGVRRGYKDGYLRKSVAQPITRVNTGDNTPAVIHYNIIPGDRVRITLLPKGFGSENMSAIGMLKPSDGREGIVSFVVDTVRKAGGNPCPPTVVGVGIGGTFEWAAYMAKHALSRRTGEPSSDTELAALEALMLEKINGLGIGAQGFGGAITSFAVHCESYPTHIAGLPVAVNIQCHCARHQYAEI